MKYLVSNIGGRNHEQIFAAITSGAFFDLTPRQHGWAAYIQIGVGDIVYVIEKDRTIKFGYEVTGLMDGIELADDAVWGDNVGRFTGGSTRVLFGKVVEPMGGVPYSDFVMDNGITSPKLNPKTGKMYPGFNCIALDI